MGASLTASAANPNANDRTHSTDGCHLMAGAPGDHQFDDTLSVGQVHGLMPVSLLDRGNLVDSTVPSIPEPSSWAMLLAGASALVVVLRNRRS
jgi:hypothetical protein